MLRAREHQAGTQSDAENVSGEQTGSPNLLQALRGQAGLTDGTKLIQSIKINKIYQATYSLLSIVQLAGYTFCGWYW